MTDVRRGGKDRRQDRQESRERPLGFELRDPGVGHEQEDVVGCHDASSLPSRYRGPAVRDASLPPARDPPQR